MLPDHLRRSARAAWLEKELKCPECSGRARFEVLYFVNIEEWPELHSQIDVLREQTADCMSCGHRAPVRSPLIVEVPRHNLLIFVTHSSDDEGVETGFGTWLGYAEQLTGEVMETARTRPYTFVHGWTGLAALLALLSGEEAEAAAPPYAHETDDQQGLSQIAGYIHGPLFFYYPEHRAVRVVVGTLLHFADDAASEQRAKRIRRLILRCMEIVGDSHPWLRREAGRLSLLAGEHEIAEEWLTKTIEAEHCWLTPTMSFVDGTPIRRAGATPQGTHLPHALPSEGLRDVTRQFHSVCQTFPRKKDYGLFYFPRMERAAASPNYTLRNIGRSLSRLLADLERELDTYAHDEFMNMFTFQSVGILRYETLMFLEDLEKAGGSPEDEHALWDEYVRSRFDIELPEELPHEYVLIKLLTEAITSALSHVRLLLHALPDDAKEFRDDLFDARIGISIHDIRRFLTGCLKHVRRRLDETVEGLLEASLEDSSIPVVRDVDDIVSEFCDYIGASVQPEEVCDYLICYAGAVCPYFGTDRNTDDLAEHMLRAHVRHIRAVTEALQAAPSILERRRTIRQSVEAFAGMGVPGLNRMMQAAHERLSAETAACDGERSGYGLHTLECPKCKSSAQYIAWHLVDTSERPALKTYVKAGSIHRIYCYYCYHALKRPSHLLYCCPEEDKFFLWIPPGLPAAGDELNQTVFRFFSSVPADYNKGRVSPVIVDKYATGWRNAERHSLVFKVRDDEQFIRLAMGSSHLIRAEEQASPEPRRRDRGIPTGGLASTPHPAADPERAARLNREYIDAMKQWHATPALKRLFLQKPVRPTGI
jgi:CpXC protein